MPSPNMPLQQVDDFEVRAVKPQEAQEELLALPYLPTRIYRRGPGSERELLSEINFYLTYQLPNICSSSYLPVTHPPLLLKPQAPVAFLSSGRHISLNCLTAFGSPIFNETPTYKIKFVFLPSICLMSFYCQTFQRTYKGKIKNYLPLQERILGWDVLNATVALL